MKTLLRYLVLLAAIPFLGGCSSAVTQSRLTQITPGMKTDQVQKILGQPTRIDQSEITGLTGQVYHYISSQGDAEVVFINDAVFDTNFVSKGAHA